jgi:hypothetical protein
MFIPVAFFGVLGFVLITFVAVFERFAFNVAMKGTFVYNTVFVRTYFAKQRRQPNA